MFPKLAFVLLSSVFTFLLAPTMVSAQTESVLSPAASDSNVPEQTRSFVVADVNVGDAQATEVDGVVSGSFSLRGNMGQQNRIAMGVVVRNEDGELLHVQPIESEVDSIRQDEIKTIPFSYRFPGFLGGMVTVFVHVETTGGLPLGTQKVLEKKLPENSRQPVNCEVVRPDSAFACSVEKEERKISLRYHPQSLFVPAMKKDEAISIGGTAKMISPDLPAGRYWVAAEEIETGRMTYFPFRMTGTYGVIQNAVISSGEETGVAQVVISTMVSPIQGTSATIELRDQQGVACGLAATKAEGPVKEAVIATPCVSGVAKIELKNAAGGVLDTLEEPFSVHSGVLGAASPEAVTQSVSEEEKSSVSKVMIVVAVAIAIIGLIALLLYRYKYRKTFGALLFMITFGVGLFGVGVPRVDALSLFMMTWGSTEAAWTCFGSVSLDKATYFPGETATLSGSIDLSGDVDSRGAGSCAISYSTTSGDVNAAFDTEVLWGLNTIVSVGPVGMGASAFNADSTTMFIPAHLTTGAHNVRRIYGRITGNCWGGCAGDFTDEGPLGFSVGAYAEGNCGDSVWMGGLNCIAGEPVFTDCGPGQSAFIESGTTTRSCGASAYSYTANIGRCVNDLSCTACRTNLVVTSSDVCPANCLFNANIHRVSNPSTGPYNQAWWDVSGAPSNCVGSCATYPLSGHPAAEIASLPFCALPPPPICVLGANAWAGLTTPNFWFGGAASGWSERIKTSLCPAGQVMTGTRSWQHHNQVDEEYEEARCAPGAAGLGAPAWHEAPNAYDDLRPGNKTVMCPAGQVMVGTRMYGAFSSVDEEHIDAYCATPPAGTVLGAPIRVNGSGAVLESSFKNTLCPANHVMVGVNWYQWGAGLDEEHTDAFCAPITLACGPSANITAVPGAIVSLPDTWWQRLWKHIRGINGVAHASGSANIIVNQQAILSWSSSGVDSCTVTANPAVPSFPLSMPPLNVASGTYPIPAGTLSPGTTYTFTMMNCTGASGNAAPDSTTIIVAAPTDFKLCPTTPAPIAPSSTAQMRAYYVTTGTVNCGNLAGAIEATSSPLINWSSANAGIASVNNAGSKGLITGVAAGTIAISATFMTSSASENVTVSCTPTAACTDAGPQATAANTCAGSTFNISDGCSGTIVCSGTRTCDFNWKEVGQ